MADTVAVNPDELDRIPWAPDCFACGRLRQDPQPGLHTWVQTVAQHFELVHRIVLVGR